MAVRIDVLTVCAADPEAAATFWGDLMRWRRDGASLVRGSDGCFGLAFVESKEPVVLPNQVHLHLSSTSSTQSETVARALALGATHVAVGQLPEEDHVVLADPEGNAFCVIEEGNSWLAGTPLLGELACDGTREVGVFWSAALDWPLIHDVDGETAIQAPEGGPKIAWGGPPLDERHGRNRMHFVLVADDLRAEVGRLVGLGARVVARSEGDIEMVDPDGNEFHVRAQ